MTALRVLTVDDSRTILAMLHHTLSNAGFEVLQAEDGKQGLDLLKTQDFDVIITDINMPVMDGIEFIRHVRATGQHQSLPILILTTETSQDKRDQGKAAGGTGWIVKPFDPEKLISVIHRVVH
ncbi:response regulator [Devosia neptuniae]|jgi:two-component system chemotaxis response regulator CheY|uniref:Response regulator n=1 Tax=Devosia neptuniae TaxID=191302 RepID=A0ABY6CH99_9HYPH|nr:MULTISPECIES: response regulator [Devosia]KFC71812.1 Chemotaxis regulator-transmits chemoreceptor signals to flagelllar motor components CheY [Devosia sp. LC5]UXN71598.1 response regulator [Devosia neptuniae]